MPDWADRFLKALRETPNVSAAAEAAGVDRTWTYRCREMHPDFAEAWDNAINRSLDRLEASMFKRAEDTSDTLAIFLMKSHRPEVYGEKIKIDFNGTVELDWGSNPADQDAPAPPAPEGGEGASGPV